jgi:integrase
MFNHARQQNVVRAVPYIRMLKEDNVRTGFVEQDVFMRMVDEAAKEGPWLRTFVEMAYRYGWRSGELIGLRVKQVDLKGRTIRLEPGTTKNGRGREVAMIGVVHQLLTVLCEGKGPEDHVFTRHDGERVRDFRAAWQNMCVRAGVPGSKFECKKCEEPMDAGVKFCRAKGCGGERRYVGLIVHDMRRSAARNMLASGMREKLVMDVGGWLTREVMYRYALPNLAEQRAALEKMEESINPLMTPLGTKAGVVDTGEGKVTVQ